MIDELFDPLSKIKGYEIYVNNVKVDNKIVTDKVISIELEFNYFRPYSKCVIVCAEEVFSLNINKHPSELTNKDSVKIVFSDNLNKIFQRRYIVQKVSKNENCERTDSEYWIIEFVDVYGFSLLSSEYIRYITQKGYKGIPLKIVEDCLKDVMLYQKEISKLYGDKALKFKTVYNNIGVIDCPQLEHRFPKDNTPLESLEKFCKEYNILLYQDYDTFYIIQNPKISELEKPKETVYKERVGTKTYADKICEKINRESSIPTDERPNYRISLNSGGKNQSIRELKFTDLLNLIELNKHDNTEFKDDNFTYYPSTVNTLSALYYEQYRKYLTANNLIIYVRPTLEKSNVGTITSVQLDSYSDVATRRVEGDVKFSGNWLIRSCTYKLLQTNLIGRLILCRYDNQEDLTHIQDNNVMGNKEDYKEIGFKPEKSVFEEVNQALDDIKDKLKNIIDPKDTSKESAKRKKENILKELRK